MEREGGRTNHENFKYTDIKMRIITQRSGGQSIEAKTGLG